jgi:hypothetical protein
MSNWEIRTAINGHGIGLKEPLHVEILSDGRSARLLRSFLVRVKDGQIIEVPQGFVTDFASVPRIFWRIIPPWGEYSPAAVVHDWLYTKAKCKRKEADDIFLELMERLGVPVIVRTAMYWAVRIGGGIVWGHPRKENRNVGNN